jgi:hypothetical protein
LLISFCKDGSDIIYGIASSEKEYGSKKFEQGAKCDLITLQNRVILRADFCFAAEPEILG